MSHFFANRIILKIEHVSISSSLVVCIVSGHPLSPKLPLCTSLKWKEVVITLRVDLVIGRQVSIVIACYSSCGLTGII